MEYLTLGPTPYDEPCQQVGTASYNHNAALTEMRRYQHMLETMLETEFGKDSLQIRLTVKSFPHDFGSYSEVCVMYNPDDQTSVNQAFWLDNNLPANWS